MNTVKRVEVRNMKDFEIKTTYNVLGKSFDSEVEAREYARNIKTVISLYIGSKDLEEWIEEQEKTIPNSKGVETRVNDFDLIYTLGDVELTDAGNGSPFNHIRVKNYFSLRYAHRDGKIKVYSVAVADRFRYCK